MNMESLFESVIKPVMTFLARPEILVPLMAVLVREVSEAQWARGAQRSVRAFAVPLIVRALRQADALGESLVARGVDD